MVAELKALAGQLGRRPTLIEYLAETRYELIDVYKPSIGGWYALLNDAQFLTEPPTEADILLIKRFQLLLHIDSIRRLRFYQSQLSKGRLGSEPLPELERRMVANAYISPTPGRGAAARRQLGNWIDEASAKRSAGAEFQELCDALLDLVKLHTDERPCDG